MLWRLIKVNVPLSMWEERFYVLNYHYRIYWEHINPIDSYLFYKFINNVCVYQSDEKDNWYRHHLMTYFIMSYLEKYRSNMLLHHI